MTGDQRGYAGTFAARHGLVRPVQGRYVAGVCAALGRATRTDPALWRVGLAVLICFAGIGAVLYLLIWLISPEEGDTGSPLESLLGRGRSNTSPAITVVLGLVLVGLMLFILPRPLYVVLGGLVVLAILLLINRATLDRTAAAAPPQDAPPEPRPADPLAEPFPDPFAEPATVVPPDEPATVVPPPAASPGPPPTLSWPTGATGPVPGASSWAPQSGYRPPFAPRGPFAGPPLSAPPLRPPRPPRPPRERSALPALILFAGVMALAVVGALDLAGVDVPVAGYVATALAVVGGGLVVGAWLGRARLFIAFGAALALLLPTVHVAESWDRPEYVGSTFSWRPTSVAELREEYALALGEGELDLTALDFSGRQLTVTVEVSFGEIRVRVPPDVAVEAHIDNRFSATRVFGSRSEGTTDDTVQDPGSGDPADGSLRLELSNRFGNLEVDRGLAAR